MAVQALYFVTFLVSLLLLTVNLIGNKKANTLFVVFSLSVAMNCWGTFLLSVSGTLEVAILANKILYVGGCFTAPLAILLIVQTCNIRWPGWLTALLFGLGAVTYGFVLTIGHSEIYYKSVELAQTDGYYYLVKEYGPAHRLQTIYMILCILIMLGHLIAVLTKNRSLSFKMAPVISIVGIAVILCYILARLFNSKIEWMSIGFLIGSVMMMLMLNRFNMYDMTINIAHYSERAKDYGYIVFDNKQRFINANDFARALFPEIETWTTDSIVKPSSSMVYTDIVSKLESRRASAESDVLFIHDRYLGDRYIEVQVRDISYNNRSKIIGCIVELADKTYEHKYLKTIESFNDTLQREVTDKTKDILHIKDMLVLGMATMVEGRDNSTGGHIRRTSDVVRIFAGHLLTDGNSLGFEPEFLEMVVKAAPMHDLGKIAVDDRILRKQGKFTNEEYAEMKKHSAEGEKIVEKILRGVEDEAFVVTAKNIAKYHHEKWNGCGYPCSVAGEAIPVEARIMALADVFDALVSKRCYKEAFSFDRAFSIIEEDLGSHFDPVLGRYFLTCRPELEALYTQYLTE